VQKVLDGDSFVDRKGRQYRLIGVDAPEKGEKRSEQAKRFLARAIEGKEVRLAFDEQTHDRFGRLLVYVYARGKPGEDCLNVQLLREGLAKLYLVPPNLGRAPQLRQAQKEAVLGRRGIWSEKVKPEAYYVGGKYRFHRPSCPHVRDIPHPRRFRSRWEALLQGLGPCRSCRP